MPGACECADEQCKDVKCCICLDSYCWFKVLAWVNMVLCTIVILTIFALIAMISAVKNAVENGDGTITDPDGTVHDVSTLPDGEKVDFDSEEVKAGMGQLIFALLCLLISFVCSAMFVCCDSARSRKIFAGALVVGGLG